MRSRKAAGGKKGRSFKGRKDKMREHLRTVHGKAGKKRGRGDSDGEESFADGLSDVRTKLKRRT